MRGIVAEKVTRYACTLTGALMQGHDQYPSILSAHHLLLFDLLLRVRVGRRHRAKWKGAAASSRWGERMSLIGPRRRWALRRSGRLRRGGLARRAQRTCTRASRRFPALPTPHGTHGFWELLAACPRTWGCEVHEGSGKAMQ